MEVPESLLLIAGDGPERSRLEALVRELGIAPAVRFLGVQSDMEAILSALDVFVLTSHSEGFSNAILEAMGMGLPVVASKVGGNIEMVEDGVNGFLVDPGDSEGVDRRLLELAREPERRRAMGMAGRRWVERTNSREVVFAAFRDLYQGVLDG